MVPIERNLLDLEYDQEANAAYVRFSQEPVAKTEQVKDGVIFDYDAEGRIVGLELLNVRAKLAPASFSVRTAAT